MDTYRIPFSGIGYSANPNFDNVPANSLVSPSKNLNLHEGGIGPRGGTAHVNSAALTDTPDINGLYDFRLISGTRYILAATADGNIYKDADGTETAIETGLTTDSFSEFITYNNQVYITCYKSTTATVPMKWDGTTFADVGSGATLPSDWTSTTFPKQLVVHGYGNSERIWCFAAPGKQNWIYITPNNDGATAADFSQATILTMYIETGDGYGLVGGVVYQDRLIAFGKRKAYIIDDSDVNTDLWGYVEASWEGGAASHRLIVKTPNDIICMMDDGEIYSVTAVQSYGDYKLASITRPHFMHVWIKDNLDLSKIAQFHGIYDPKLRAVRFFVVRSGQTVCDTILTYYIDLGKWGPPEDNLTNPSGCKAACSALVKESTGEYNVWTGDYDGFIWKLNQATKSDNALAYSSVARIPYLSFESEDDTGLSTKLKTFQSARIIGTPKGDYSVSIEAIADGNSSRTETIDMGNSTTIFDGTAILDEAFDIGMTGKRLALEISNATAAVDYFFTGMDVFFKAHGEQDNLFVYPSGIAWVQVSVLTGTFRAVVWNDTTLVAVGDSVCATSTDGVTWTSRTIPALEYRAVGWNGTVFVAAGALIFGAGEPFATSPDGITWTARTFAYDGFRGVAWNGTVFAAVGGSIAATSSDGITWTLRTIPSGTYYSVAWNGTVFVAVGQLTKCATSPDGITWTARTISAGSYTGVAWNGTVFAAVGTSGVCATSPDGTTWTARTIPTGNYNSIAWNGNLFVAVGANVCATSTDGITWITRSIPAGTYYGIDHNDIVFVAVGTNIGAIS